MVRPLSLRALFTLRRGKPNSATPSAPWPERPAGTLLWYHAESEALAMAAQSLLDAFLAEGERATLLLTARAGSMPAGLSDRVIQLELPDDQSDDAARFIAYWRPAMLIWAGHRLRPRILEFGRDHSMIRILVDVDSEDSLVEPGGPSLPGITRAILGMFDEAICPTAERATQLVRSGLPQDRIRIMNPLEASPPILRYVESDRQEMAAALGTRPVWLCVDPQGREIDDVIGAHRQAVRRAHRLLLVIAARDPDAIAPLIRQEGLELAQRLDGDEPSFSTDVLLADMSELGLWYRLSPTTFSGGSVDGEPSRDPYEAAALGSAVIHGPILGTFQDRFRALDDAGASMAVSNGRELGYAVVGLLSADRTAQIAHAGWDVVTRGADTMTHLTERFRDASDRAGA